MFGPAGGDDEVSGGVDPIDPAEDGENIPLELHLAMVERIVQAVDLPVSMDFEAGYGDAGETARRAIAAGVVGGNLEDQVKPLDEAVAAVEAVLAAGRAAGIDFVLNARTDVFVLRRKGADRKELMREAVRRGKAFLAAGAPVVFVPGVMTRDEIEILVTELGPRKASLIAVPGVTPPTSELERMGVARVSTGPFTQYGAQRAQRSKRRSRWRRLAAPRGAATDPTELRRSYRRARGRPGWPNLAGDAAPGWSLSAARMSHR